jgi:DNA-binding NarL/FixJ family response regulator
MKDTPDTLMVTQLQQISHGLPALSPAVARRLMGHFRRTGPITAEAVLTQRESEVLALISRGLRNAEVAGSLGIAESTVAGYIKSIYRKLGISSRAEAAWHAAQLGL